MIIENPIISDSQLGKNIVKNTYFTDIGIHNLATMGKFWNDHIKTKPEYVHVFKRREWLIRWCSNKDCSYLENDSDKLEDLDREQEKKTRQEINAGDIY